MADFKSGLWVNDKGSFCLWEEERPDEGEEEMAYFYEVYQKRWLYTEVCTDTVNDYKLTDYHLTSWS